MSKRTWRRAFGHGEADVLSWTTTVLFGLILAMSRESSLMTAVGVAIAVGGLVAINLCYLSALARGRERDLAPSHSTSKTSPTMGPEALYPYIDIPFRLLELIRGMPSAREVTHCGETFEVSPFDIYATCQKCSTTLKVRSFAEGVELEDVFDAVFEWVERSQADDFVLKKRREIREAIAAEIAEA